VVFLNVSEYVKVFVSLVNICIAVRSKYQEVVVGIVLPSLTPLKMCACPKPGPGFSNVVVIFMFNYRGDCSFVDTDGIVDHHYLNFVFIILILLHYNLRRYMINVN